MHRCILGLTLVTVDLITEMEKRDLDNLKVFNGNKFVVWKFYMENFDAKDILRVVDSTIPKPPNIAPEAEKTAWNKANALAKSLISSAVSFQVPRPRTNRR